MNSWRAVTESFPSKIYLQGPVTVHSVVGMIDFADLFLHFCLIGIIISILSQF